MLAEALTLRWSRIRLFFCLTDPWLCSSVTPQCLTIEAQSQARTVRNGDDPLLVGRDRPVEQLGPKGVRVLVELEQV